MIYILNKYEGLYDDLKEFCKIPKDPNDESNSIPYWLILLRLLANRENIEVDYNQEYNSLSKRISEVETDFLKKQLIELKKDNNNKINASWLNLCIKNLKNSSLHYKKLRNVFEYIFYQIQNMPRFEKQISDIVEKNLTNFNNEIIKLNFENDLDFIFNMTLDEDEDLIKIINDPKEFYHNKIQEKYDEIIENLINNQNYNKLIEFYKGEINQTNNQQNAEGKPFITFYNSLKDEINNTLKEIDDSYKITLDGEITKATDEKVNSLKDILNNINDCTKDIEDLIKEEENQKNEINDDSNDDGNTNNSNGQNVDTFEKFNELIKEYEEYFQKIKKNEKYIQIKEKNVLIYALIEISLDEIKPIYKKEVIKNDTKHDGINIVVNSKKLKEKNLKLDLTSQTKNKKISFYMPKEEGVEMKKLIKLKNKEEEIEWLQKNESKYYQELSFLEKYYGNNKNYYYKRNIVFEIKIRKIIKYEIINIDKEKIRKDIEISSNKSDNRKTLYFGQETFKTNTELFKMLENFNKNNKNFAKAINDIKNNKKINCKIIMDNIDSLFKEQENITKYLKCNCSDGTQYPKITTKLNDIQNYFNQLFSLFKNFDLYLRNNVKDITNSYDIDIKLVDSMLKNVKIKSPISNHDTKFSFNSIDPDSEFLSTLILSEENGIVACSQTDISKDFGTFVSSLIKGDFSIFILSMINDKLMPRKEISEQKYEKIIDIKNEIEANELFTLNIKIPKKTQVDDEEFDIKFNLCLGNNKLSEIKIPCNFNFILSSLKIKIECLNYDIIINNNELFLGTTYLDENEIIKFKVTCLNENIKPDFKFSYRGNDENEAKEPK